MFWVFLGIVGGLLVLDVAIRHFIVPKEYRTISLRERMRRDLAGKGDDE